MKIRASNYHQCEICRELLGPHSPVIELSIGFCEDPDFYIEESITVHIECVDTSVVGRLLERLQPN